MRRIPVLIEKLQELAEQGKDITVLDVDLMLDYTRVLYADLLEIRKVTPTPQTSELPEAKQELPQAEEQEAIPATDTKYAEITDIDIRTRIGINDKYLFISELFADDKSAYDNAIKKLNSFTQSSEAEEWIRQELHSKYNWSDENETVLSFYELVKNSFSSI